MRGDGLSSNCRVFLCLLFLLLLLILSCKLFLVSLTLFNVTTVTRCDHFPTIGTRFLRGGPTTPTSMCLEAVRSL